jgi:hypothetical protein
LDKENISDDEVKPKKKHCNQLLEIVQQCNATNVKRLQKAREVNEKQHVELQQLQQHLINLQKFCYGFWKAYQGDQYPRSRPGGREPHIMLRNQNTAVKMLNDVQWIPGAIQVCFKPLSRTITIGISSIHFCSLSDSINLSTHRLQIISHYLVCYHVHHFLPRESLGTMHLALLR